MIVLMAQLFNIFHINQMKKKWKTQCLYMFTDTGLINIKLILN